MSQETPQETLKPLMKAAVPAAVLASIVAAGLMAGAVYLLMQAVTGQMAVMLFAVLTVLFSTLRYGNLQARKYLFYEDHVEVYEGFLTVTQDNIPYDRVTDVAFAKSVWQRLFDVGTIRLNTAGSDHHEVAISYISDPQETYDQIREIVSG